MCDLDGVSAGSRTRPVIHVQVESCSLTNLDHERVGDRSPSLLSARSPGTSSSSSGEDITKQEAELEGSNRLRVRWHHDSSRRSTGENRVPDGDVHQDRGQPVIIVSRGRGPRGSDRNDGDDRGSNPEADYRSQPVSHSQRHKLTVSRSNTIELANKWTSDTEVESGLESDTSLPRFSPNPHHELDGPGNGQEDSGLQLSPRDQSPMSKCSSDQASGSVGRLPVLRRNSRDTVTTEDSRTANQQVSRSSPEPEKQASQSRSHEELGKAANDGAKKDDTHTAAKKGWHFVRRAFLSWSPFVQVYRRKYPWVQLAGHQGNFLPADGGRIRKKACDREASALSRLMNDDLRQFVPQFFRQVEVDDEQYLEMQDLLAEFDSPAVMDIKMGVRTYLEEELTKARKSPAYRKDLYQKMLDVDPNEPTPEEHSRQAITKPRYMQFRENASSSSTLGFRIEGIKLPMDEPRSDFKKVRARKDVAEELRFFLSGKKELWARFLDRLKELRKGCESSEFFYTHEIIGSSLLFVGQHSNSMCGVWIIDFGKTSKLPNLKRLNHRIQWVEGNREDGYLWGLDNLIEIWSSLFDDDSKQSTANSISAMNLAGSAEANQGRGAKQSYVTEVKSAGYSTEV